VALYGFGGVVDKVGGGVGVGVDVMVGELANGGDEDEIWSPDKFSAVLEADDDIVVVVVVDMSGL